MLEKKTIDVNVDAKIQETNLVKDQNGNEISVLKMIPYRDKEAFIQELAARVIAVDEETGMAYVSAYFDLVYQWLFVKYYTNIDTDPLMEIEQMYQLYDYCEINGIDDQLTPENRNDADILREYWWRYSDTIIQLYKKSHSLEQMAKSMFNGDVDTENAETRELIEKLIDMKEAYQEKQDRPAKNVGGGILNFAKR